MTVTKYDILDLVSTTVKFLCCGIDNAPDVRLDGKLLNILIGCKPVSIADIENNRHSEKGLLKLIRGAM